MSQPAAGPTVDSAIDPAVEAELPAPARLRRGQWLRHPAFAPPG